MKKSLLFVLLANLLFAPAAFSMKRQLELSDHEIEQESKLAKKDAQVEQITLDFSLLPEDIKKLILLWVIDPKSETPWAEIKQLYRLKSVGKDFSALLPSIAYIAQHLNIPDMHVYAAVGDWKSLIALKQNHEHRADHCAYFKDRFGMNALDYAQGNNHQELKELLQYPDQNLINAFSAKILTTNNFGDVNSTKRQDIFDKIDFLGQSLQEREIFFALNNDDTFSDKLSTALADGCNVNSCFSSSGKPLALLIIRKNDAEALREFLQYCCPVDEDNQSAVESQSACLYDVNQYDYTGETMLNRAIKKGSDDCVDYLLTHPKIDINKGNVHGTTPLHWAIIHNNADLVEYLLSDKSINPNAYSAQGKAPLHLAIQHSDRGFEVLDMLLAHKKINLNVQDAQGSTVLHWAVNSSKEDWVKKLFACSSLNPNILDNAGNAPIHKAGVWMLPKLLVNKRVNVNLKNNDGKTKLHLVAENGESSSIRELLEHGADINLKDNAGKTAEDLAQESGDDQTISTFKNILRDAVCAGDAVKLEWLLKNGSLDVNVRNEYGYTLLYSAVQNNEIDCVRVLLNHPDIDVNFACDDGCTPLHTAVQHDDEEAVALLLTHKDIDVNCVEEEGRTPVHFACSVSILKMLIQAGADLEHRGSIGETVLHTEVLNPVVSSKSVECIDYILQNFPEMITSVTNAVEPDILIGLMTPLHIAAMGGNVACVIKLLEYGADKNACTQDGKTPLDWAKKSREEIDVNDVYAQRSCDEVIAILERD